MVNIWNPWHGCTKKSEGCAHCYVYRRDESIGKDASVVEKTKDFDLPVRKKRTGEWKIAPGTHLFACMTSDFFLDVADEWRPDVWEMIRTRSDVEFTIITKRIERMGDCVPPDWGDGYENVTIGCTCENQRRADERMPVFLSLPIRHRFVVCEPMLGPVRLDGYLNPEISQVVAGGESGPGARALHYDWVLDLRAQCVDAGVSFYFKQTGANFIKDGKHYRIERALQMPQARKAHIDI